MKEEIPAYLILGAAFEQHMYKLKDLSFYGSNRFGNMSEAPDYKSGYHQLLNQASDKDSQIKIKEFPFSEDSSGSG